MPIRPIEYIDQPFVPNVGNLAQMLQRGGDLRAQQILAGGQGSAATWAGLAQAFNQYQQGIRAKQEHAAALALKEQERREANALKLREIEDREAERKEQNRIRLEAEGRQKRADALKLAGDIASQVGRGPLAEAQVDPLMESPETMGRVRYEFGPGTAQGPALQPTPAQLRQDKLDESLIDQRNQPPAKKSLQRETAIVNGKPVFVNFDPETGAYSDLAGNQVTPTPVPPRAPGDGGPRPLTQTAEAQIIQRLNTQWGTAQKPIKELERQVALMDTGMEAVKRGDMAQGAQMVLVTFQKILDPPSVVRESEFMRSAAGQSLMNRVKGAYERLSQGGAGVTAEELQKFATLAREAATAQRTAANLEGVQKRITGIASRYNIPPELIFEDIAPATSETPQDFDEEWVFDANGNLVKKGGG